MKYSLVIKRGQNLKSERHFWASRYNNQRQALELVSGPCLGAKARILSFNRAQSRAVTGLLTGHTLMKYLPALGLSDIPLCRRCEAEEETSAHILCECVASHRHAHLGSFFLEPEDIKSLWGGGHLEIWQSNRSPMNRYGTQRTRQLRPRCIGTVRSRTLLLINQSFSQSINQSMTMSYVFKIRSGCSSVIALFIFWSYLFSYLFSRNNYLVIVKIDY